MVHSVRRLRQFAVRLSVDAFVAVVVSAVAIQRLASQVSKWNAECDQRLQRLMAHISANLDLVLHGSLSEEDNDVLVPAL